jgi:molybdate-binding protein
MLKTVTSKFSAGTADASIGTKSKVLPAIIINIYYIVRANYDVLIKKHGRTKT